MSFIPNNIFLHIGIIVVAFYLLARTADLLVEGAVGVAYRLNVPKMVIGILLVGFMTTVPEFTVSMISAVQGQPGIAFGNGVGSVIADSFALALGILFAPRPISVDKRVLRTTGLFLIGADVAILFLSLSGTIGRGAGILLLGILVGYLAFMLIAERRESKNAATNDGVDDLLKPAPLAIQLLRFFAGVAGILVASEFLVNSAEFVATFAGVPQAVIGLTLIAIGTSIPEIATAITAARKGHGDLALGDILGADILNIVWVIGAAATAHPLVVGTKVTSFSLPAMIIVVLITLGFARMGYRLERWKGIVLVVIYAVYLALTIFLFR
ncbi:MAG TPA: calcium/sodium antiporter [Spirochaetia bacterium]|nr:calcium/sodium antiporter [Spirochaetia bacterium]